MNDKRKPEDYKQGWRELLEEQERADADKYYRDMAKARTDSVIMALVFIALACLAGAVVTAASILLLK